MTIPCSPLLQAGPGSRRSPTRGFAAVTVMFATIFIGMAVMAMTALFAHEAKRTQATLAQTQLRQLLLAAVPAAQSEIQTPGTRDVPLTVPLQGATVVLHVNGRTVHVVAAYHGAQAAQTLTFENGKLAAASLDQAGGL
jgi:hypothetical protein